MTTIKKATRYGSHSGKLGSRALCVGYACAECLNVCKHYLSRQAGSLAYTQTQTTTLSRREWILSQFKRAAQQHVRNKDYQVWTHENHAVEISPHIKGMAASKMAYIHNNPVEAGVVARPEDYLYSSARDYTGMKGLINLKLW